jgi:hypothetical protein
LKLTDSKSSNVNPQFLGSALVIKKKVETFLVTRRHKKKIIFWSVKGPGRIAEEGNAKINHHFCWEKIMKLTVADENVMKIDENEMKIDENKGTTSKKRNF